MSIRHMTATEKIPLAMKTENRFMQYESRCARLNYISFFTFLPLLKFQANLKVDLLHPSSKITSLLIQATSYLTDCQDRIHLPCLHLKLETNFVQAQGVSLLDQKIPTTQDLLADTVF